MGWNGAQRAIALGWLLAVMAPCAPAADSPLAEEPNPATGTGAVDLPPKRPAEDQRQPSAEAPNVISLPRHPLERAALQPERQGALVDGQWVSPQWVLGQSGDLPRAFLGEAASPERAPGRFQPADSPPSPQRRAELDRRIEPELVARYAEAPIVRFVAPREVMTSLFEELDLDDFNRYQFRRNRPEGVPVERVAEAAPE